MVYWKYVLSESIKIGGNYTFFWNITPIGVFNLWGTTSLYREAFPPRSYKILILMKISLLAMNPGSAIFFHLTFLQGYIYSGIILVVGRRPFRYSFCQILCNLDLALTLSNSSRTETHVVFSLKVIPLSAHKYWNGFYNLLEKKNERHFLSTSGIEIKN